VWHIEIGTAYSIACCSVLFFGRSRSDGWLQHGRTFSIYLCPLSFWLTLPRGVLSTYWCCPSRPCVVFLACVHLAGIIHCIISFSSNSLVSMHVSEVDYYYIDHCSSTSADMLLKARRSVGALTTNRYPDYIPDYFQNLINYSLVHNLRMSQIHKSRSVTFWVMLLTNRQALDQNITPANVWRR